MAKKSSSQSSPQLSAPIPPGIGPSAADVAVAEKIRAAARKDPIIGVILSVLFDHGPLMFTKLVEEVQKRTLATVGRIQGKIGDAKGFGFIKISEPPLMVCRLSTEHSVGMTVIREFSNPGTP